MRIQSIKTICLLLTVLFLSSNILADSPLTSTDFADAYKNVQIVQTAATSSGILNEDLMDYLTNPKEPVDVKMAVINKLGWDIEGKNNSRTFFAFLQKKYRYSSERNFLDKGRGDDLLAMAYLKALDNYFDVSDALQFAERALKKNKKSRTFAIVAGLIRAQKAFDSDWCEVFKIMDGAKSDTRLKNDMRPEAITIIFEYIDLYKSSCD